MFEGFKAFLLLLVITTTNTNGGVSVTTERFYVPHEAACLEVKALFEAEHTWEQYVTKGYFYKIYTLSVAKATCIPLRGVQRMPH